jgi:hypothetical protein
VVSGNVDKGGRAYFAVLGEVDLQCLGIVLEPKGCHGEENIFTIDRLSLLLVALLRCCDE